MSIALTSLIGPEPGPEEEPKQAADPVTTSVGLLGALQVVENRLKD